MNSKPVSKIYKVITLQLAMLLCIYQGIRLLFFCINHAYFQDVGIGQYLRLASHGFRFDLSAVFGINLPYLLLSLLPVSIVSQRWYQRMLNILFISSNSLAFLFDLADIGYYPYVRKRMTAEVFHLLGKKSDFIDLLPSYLREFWFVPILAVCVVTGFVWLNRKIKSEESFQPVSFTLKRWLFYVITGLLSIVIIRGGLQLKPIMNVSALLVASNEQTPLVLNTPFSILHSLGENKLEVLDFFTEKEIESRYHPIKNYARGLPSKKSNVVVIILESFGKQYTGIGGRISYTPFLDSLMTKGKVFTNAFANAHRSADGIPAVLAGIPVFMEDSYMTSPYSNNSIEGLPALLKKIGYPSSFYHGGTNGTMSFDVFAKSAGFDQYVGRGQYPNDQDYDGTWGIWDEPFLQFYANELGKGAQPFFSSVFTLSSHEPFRLPEQYQQSDFAKLEGIYKGVSYTDMALRKFFQTASGKSWYKNTLFVITADHNFLANHDSAGFYNGGMGLYSVPVIFFNPSDSSLQGISSEPMQQIDIMPSVLDYLHYPSDFFAYGNSAFDSAAHHFAYIQTGDHHQMLEGRYLLTTDNLTSSKIYDYSTDSLLHYPIQDDSLKSTAMKHFMMFKQVLQNTLIQNRQTPKSYRQK